MIESQIQGTVLRNNGERIMERIGVRLSYDVENDPLVVTMTFQAAGQGPVDWAVGREQMMRGVVSLTAYGEGDVRFKHESAIGRLLICLRSNYGHADVGVRQASVVQFLNRTADLCHLGDEPVAAMLDRELEELFGEEGS